MKAKIKNVEEIIPEKNNQEFNAAIDSIKELSLNIIKQSPTIPSEHPFAIKEY